MLLLPVLSLGPTFAIRAESEAVSSPAPVYHWIDPEGMLHYSSTPPPAPGTSFQDISGHLSAIHIQIEQAVKLPTKPAVSEKTGEPAAATQPTRPSSEAMSYCANLKRQTDGLERHLTQLHNADLVDQVVMTLQRYETQRRQRCN